ncbi:hypothetical protein [Streptomyces sp. NPDC008092]|uniref:hypothetical protein n=1 Tax=Streptomyces sp. NPDC008092 TaxID=3364808 RepID=UPI0036EBE34A
MTTDANTNTNPTADPDPTAELDPTADPNPTAEPDPTADPNPTATPDPGTAPEPQPQPAETVGDLPAAPAPAPAPVPDLDPVPAVVQPVKKDRRLLRAGLRWVAAVAVFGVVGTGTAYGITRLDRTDVPGLATRSDGRWTYPVLVKPPLPSGSPGPHDDARNPAGTHYADLRKLVLPAPRGGTADASLKGTDGWLPTKGFLAEFADADDRDELRQTLVDNGLRHITARGWTTPDGTHTRIYLLQFDTAAVAEGILNGKLMSQAAPAYALRDGDQYELDGKFPDPARIEHVLLAPYTELKPYGARQARQAYLAAGDTVGVIIQSRKGGMPAVPFEQTVTLQSELLD